MEMLWNLKYGEAPKADLILARMSEADICLLTGETLDLLTIPVNYNTSNMLPTNMACISKRIVKEMEYTYNYKVRCQNNLTVVFDTPECFVEYNKTLVEALGSQLNSRNFLELYEILMRMHIKGIDKLVFEDNDSSINWTQLQRYWFNTLDKNRNQGLKIVTC